MLEIKHLTKSYQQGKNAVDDISLTIDSGDIFGFIGHNGAGKTTAIKCISGILQFDTGEIILNNQNLKLNPIEYKKQIAYIPDNPELYNFLSGIEYLNFVADIFEMDAISRKTQIEKYADIFELTSALGDKISSYSHGMKQKLALISAIIHKPALLILDEPFVGLDPRASFSIKEIMKEICKDGRAIFFSTHIVEVAEKLCNKIAIIKQGKLIVSGKIEVVLKNRSLEELALE